MRWDERWPQIAEILNQALDLPPAERPSFVAKACGEDSALQQRLERLLAAEEQASGFLATPLFSLKGDEASQENDAWSRIGPYRLVHPLGRGGMGTVYLAKRDDGEFEQQVAIKLLRRGLDTEEILSRFRAERQILAQLTHPNVARLLDGGTTGDGRPFFVMEYVDGQPIHDYCDSRHLTTQERVRLFRSVCAAVDFAHRNLVVHRDLKPANVLVTADRDAVPGRVKLLDFGIAKLLRNDPGLFLTQTSQAAPMTPYYASPEQIRGEPVSTASDVYSLGVLLYELLTGHRPHHFEILTPQAVARAVCEETPPRPSTMVKQTVEVRGDDNTTQRLNPESVSRRRGADPRRLRRQLKGDLDNIVMTALRKEPERRFSSVEQLSEDLGRYLRGLPVRSRADTFAYRSGKFIRRHAWGVAAAALIATLGLGLTVMAVTSGARKARIERMDAEIARERRLSGSVTSFLVNFLKSSDPSRSEGRMLTVQEAFDIAVARLGSDLEDAPEIRATLVDAVGGVYRDLGFYEEARPFLEEALKLRRDRLGGEHPLVAESLHNLAHLEFRIGRYKRAEELMRRAIAVQRQAFPEGHQDLARGLNNLASLLRREGRPDEAEVPAREALAMKLSLFGGVHPEVAYTLNTLAVIKAQQGETEEAEELYRRTIEIRRAAGPVSQELATALNNLAALLVDEGRLKEALPLHLEALRLRRQLYPGGHRYVVESFNNLAYLRTLLGEFEEARTLFSAAITMAEGLPGRPLWAILKKNQAFLLGRAGEFAACEEAALEALSGFRDDETARLAEAESIRGGCVAAQGRFGEAEPLLLSSHQTLLEALGEEARPTRHARQRLADAYEAWGRPEEAARFRMPERQL